MPLLTLASSPGTDRLRVLQITLHTLSRLDTWFDLGCGEAGSTTPIYPLPPGVRRVSVDAVDPIDPPDGFVRQTIQDFLESHGFGSRSLVSLLDVIEHFPEAEGTALLEKLEREARAIIIFTPDGFYRQDAVTHPEFADKPFQWHRSGWTTEVFLARGYTVVKFPQLHMGFGGVAAVRVVDWSRWDYATWRLGIERLRMRPFVAPSTALQAWKEHVRFRHTNSWWYALGRGVNRRLRARN